MLLRRHNPMRSPNELKKDEVSEQEREDLKQADGVNLGDDESDQDLPGNQGGSKDLNDFTVAELKEQAKERGLEGYNDLKKAELVELLKGE